MPDLHKLIYVSQASENVWADMSACVEAILNVSVKNNAERGLTGALLALDRHFLQILEGRKPDVDAIYSRIASDSRHEKLKVLRAGPIEAREFGKWSMCAAVLSRTDSEIVDVLKHRRELDLGEIAPGMAEQLLKTIRGIKLKRSDTLAL